MENTYLKSQELLSHYLDLALRSAGVRVDSDVRQEIESILSVPFLELIEQVAELEKRVEFIEQAFE